MYADYVINEHARVHMEIVLELIELIFLNNF